ncbi:MAG TPA: hypothetical protein VKJ45_09820, partial [Blastocatellia bacterium]|nr:hypothetical protein [Blastocatellia bacterium]
QLAIDGVLVQGVSAISDSMGSLLVTLSNSPAADGFELPVQFQPVTAIGHVELRDEEGRVVLDGDYAPVDMGVCPTEQIVDKEASLASAVPQRLAGGRATLVITADRVTLAIVAGGIQDSSCAISVDGVSCGWANTQGGYTRVDLSSDGSTGKWVPGILQPYINIRHVEVKDRSGQVVLQGNFRF